MKKLLDKFKKKSFLILFFIGLIYTLTPILPIRVDTNMATYLGISGYGLAIVSFAYATVQENKSTKDSNLLNNKIDLIMNKLNIENQETIINEETYIENRLQEQIDWYDKNAILYKKYHNNINSISIIVSSCGSLITILGLVFECAEPWLTILGSLASVTVASALAIDKLKNYGNLFLNYRKTCETLKREKILFQTKSGEYQNNENAFNLLVERCESIMATENGTWVQLNEKKKD